MFITTVPNRNSNPAILLRESYREDGKVHVRTLANLTHWTKEKIATLDAALHGGRITVDGEFDLMPGRAHGNVHAVLGTMRRLEMENILGSRPSPERNLAMALVAGRVIEPGSRLSLARAVAEEIRSTTLGEELDVVNTPVESFYFAMDWLLERRDIIEKRFTDMVHEGFQKAVLRRMRQLTSGKIDRPQQTFNYPATSIANQMA